MAAARVDLNGALIRSVEDPYYNHQGWGSPPVQPWWTVYNVGNTTPMATSNTPQISGDLLIRNALQQGWNAMVSPRKGVSEATTEVSPPEGGSEATTEVKPPVTTATAITQPLEKPVVIQPATVPVLPQKTEPAIPAIAGVQQSSLVPTIPTIAGVQQSSLVPTIPAIAGVQQSSLVPTIPTIAGVQQSSLVPTVGMPNGLGTLPTNPVTASMPTFLEVIMAQLAKLQASNKTLTEKLDRLSANKATTGATLSCGCPAPAGNGSGDCKCTPKMDASKKTEEKKPVKETEKVASSS